MYSLESGLKFLEDSPTINCGRGSSLNEFKQVEVDACIVEGSTGLSGTF